MPKQAIIIMTDTQRTDMLGCYGFDDMITPNLDALAKEGAMYTNGYTCTPVCGPARSALFTGIYPHTNGSWTNSQPIGDNIRTIGQRLTDEGTKCAYIGKWHLDGGDYFGMGDCPKGWDEEYWYDMRTYLEELTDEERLLSRNVKSSFADWFTEEFTYGYRCTQRAIKFLEEHKDEDFLLVVSYDEPHGPSLCPPEYFKPYEDIIFQRNKKQNIYDTLENKPEHQKIWAETTEHLDRATHTNIGLQAMFACNSFVDKEIGRVKNAIDDNTPDSLIFYTSDHGSHEMSHGLSYKGPTMYEENVNIPFIIRWKGKVLANQTIDHPVSHINIVPTLMEYFCNHIPKTLEGNSILKHLENQEVRSNKYIFSEFGRYEADHDGFGGFQPIRCILDGRYKLVINLMTTDELYDLDTDPEEMDNLINSTDANIIKIRNTMHDELLQWQSDTRDPFRGYYWQCRSWRTEYKPKWDYTGQTRQREEDEKYEKRQLDYSTGLPMVNAVRGKK